jgi:predicted transcriptional regulator
MAKRMIEKYGLSQKQAAQKLGISQPAVSQYKKELRGYKAGLIENNIHALKIIEELARKIAHGELTQQEASMEFCELCKYIRPGGTDCAIPVLYANSR